MKDRRMNTPRRKHVVVRSGPACAICIPALLAVASVNAANSPDAADPIQFFVMDRYMYDDNLFRVPDGLLESDPTLARPQSLDDYVNRASAGLRLRLDASRQVFHADVRIDDVRYDRNDDLNYTGGSADLLWNFEVGSNWSGKLFGQYDKQQASLANYRFFQKDIVDVAAYGGELRYKIGSRWRVMGGIAAADTDHSADLRQTENFESTTSRGAIEYETPAGSVFALDYRFTEADFPVAESLAGAPRGYEESEPGVRIEYAYSVKTQFFGHLGYVDRDYDDPLAGDYSGEVWDVRMLWEPRSKLTFDLKAWHKLKAYADAESDYYEGDGVSIGPTWEATTKLKFAAEFSYEKQDYIGSALFLGPIVDPIEAGREDEVKGAQFSLDYTPRDLISFGLAYRWVDRESNRDFRGYDANMASAQIKLTF